MTLVINFVSKLGMTFLMASRIDMNSFELYSEGKRSWFDPVFELKRGTWFCYDDEISDKVCDWACVLDDCCDVFLILRLFLVISSTEAKNDNVT